MTPAFIVNPAGDVLPPFFRIADVNQLKSVVSGYLHNMERLYGCPSDDTAKLNAF